MIRIKLSAAMLLIGLQVILPSRCFAGYSQNAEESGGVQNSTEASLSSASEAAVSNGNEADTHQQSMASFEANSENGAVFFNITAPRYIPSTPSGLTPALASIKPPSNYVSSPVGPSNYVVTGAASNLPSHTKFTSGPQLKVWTAKGYKSHNRDNEMLASKVAPREIKQKPTEQMIAPVNYYQLSTTDDRPIPVWPGYGHWPEANAFNHD